VHDLRGPSGHLSTKSGVAGPLLQRTLEITAMTPFQHLLVPVDFGDAMQPGIDLAVALARQLDARITLLFVFDLSPFTTMSPFAPPIDVEPLIVASEKELHGVLTKVRAQWPKAEAALRRGPPSDTIVEAAKAFGCDLVVIGSRGRRGVARALLGSVAEKVVRLSPIPVLTVHPAPRVAEVSVAARTKETST
jgi:nucleotide-binding universal stress UspA family protein